MPAGSIIGTITDLESGAVDARGATHAADIQAQSGQAGLESERLATIQGLQTEAALTQGERGVGTLAMYRLADLLGIDPRQAFPGGAPSGAGAAAYPTTGDAATNPGGGYGPGATGGMTGESGYNIAGGKNPLPGGQLLSYMSDAGRNYQFSPSTLGDINFGGTPMPSAPGSEFGSLLKPFSMTDFYNNVDPSYQFRLAEGNRGIESSAAARGMQLSGANLKALDRFNQDFASEEYQNAWGRDQQNRLNTYNWLTGLSTPGLNATNTLASDANRGITGYGQDANNSITNIGNVLAGGQIAASTAIANAIRQAGNEWQGVGMGGKTPGKP